MRAAFVALALGFAMAVLPYAGSLGAATAAPIPDACQLVTVAEASQFLGGAVTQDGPNSETVKAGPKRFQQSNCLYRRIGRTDQVLELYFSRSLTRKPVARLDDLKHECRGKPIKELRGLGDGALWSEAPCLSSGNSIQKELDLVKARDLIRIGFAGTTTLPQAEAIADVVVARAAR